MADEHEPGRVLVLSDAEDIQSVLRELLEDEGYRVTTGAYLTGDIDTVTSRSPDAILIDCNRMELDESVRFLRTLRSHAHLRDTPIIACTSAVRLIDAYRPQIEELELHVIPKPFDLNILAAVIADSLARHPGATP
jgi:CheY-like chemotaxis protein